MLYLQRPKAAPRLENLPEHDRQVLGDRFDAHPAELTANGQVIAWKDIDEVEVAKAARQRSLSGWLVRNVVYHEERYHVGIYMGAQEQVLTNVTLPLAQFIVQSIAYYMQTPIKYTGVEGVAAVDEK
ncbi:MAG: hypothetical protein SF123_12900 [Chloroflexota bacterium]|nr:hypothetical protein [Chloroflexota bacterium]